MPASNHAFTPCRGSVPAPIANITLLSDRFVNRESPTNRVDTYGRIHVPVFRSILICPYPNASRQRVEYIGKNHPETRNRSPTECRLRYPQTASSAILESGECRAKSNHLSAVTSRCRMLFVHANFSITSKSPGSDSCAASRYFKASFMYPA